MKILAGDFQTLSELKEPIKVSVRQKTKKLLPIKSAFLKAIGMSIKGITQIT